MFYHLNCYQANKLEEHSKWLYIKIYVINKRGKAKPLLKSRSFKLYNSLLGAESAPRLHGRLIRLYSTIELISALPSKCYYNLSNNKMFNLWR